MYTGGGASTTGGGVYTGGGASTTGGAINTGGGAIVVITGGGGAINTGGGAIVVITGGGGAINTGGGAIVVITGGGTNVTGGGAIMVVTGSGAIIVVTGSGAIVVVTGSGAIVVVTVGFTKVTGALVRVGGGVNANGLTNVVAPAGPTVVKGCPSTGRFTGANPADGGEVGGVPVLPGVAGTFRGGFCISPTRPSL